MDNEPKRYVYNKQAGALQEAAAPPPNVAALRMRMSSAAQSVLPSQSLADDASAAEPLHQRLTDARLVRPARPADDGRDHTRPTRRPGMFSYTIEDGEHVLMIHKDGKMEELVGPRRVSTFGRTFRRMDHYVAHPGEFLVVRYRDGRQEHLVGPAHVWLDPRKHLSVTREEACSWPPRRPSSSTRAPTAARSRAASCRARQCSSPSPANGCTPSRGTARPGPATARCRTPWCSRSCG
ncbi:hypothetical protein [Nannocystis pusilla]|uniref:hypothetical protein n=1 Tax=Nannocystis pusilla TaxID=889268 RepID=UPI003B7874C0